MPLSPAVLIVGAFATLPVDSVRSKFAFMPSPRLMLPSLTAPQTSKQAETEEDFAPAFHQRINSLIHLSLGGVSDKRWIWSGGH